MKKYFVLDKNFNLKLSQPPKKEKTAKKDYFLLAKYSNIGYYLITPLFLGVVLGYYLSKKTGQQFFIIFGILAGTIGTFYNLFRLLK